MEETDLTIELLSKIFFETGMGKIASLLREYLDKKKTENPMSLSGLNLDIMNYIDKYLVHDINNGSRMIRLSNLYIPLNFIKVWKIEDKYSYAEGRIRYDLVINHKGQNPSVFDNLVASYLTKQDRQEDIEKLLEMKLSNPQL